MSPRETVNFCERQSSRQTPCAVALRKQRFWEAAGTAKGLCLLSMSTKLFRYDRGSRPTAAPINAFKVMRDEGC